MRATILRTIPAGLLLLLLLPSAGSGAAGSAAGSVPLLLTADPPVFRLQPGSGRMVPDIPGFGRVSRPGEP
ncbi:MAG TPA: hypothetical protein VNL37_01330, partial [Candidatus Polarisedimenticolia bacterium]|nr:hypothetical protein [Candidatus Polarisedimenticolia bacterium]